MTGSCSFSVIKFIFARIKSWCLRHFKKKVWTRRHNLLLRAALDTATSVNARLFTTPLNQQRTVKQPLSAAGERRSARPAATSTWRCPALAAPLEAVSGKVTQDYLIALLPASPCNHTDDTPHSYQAASAYTDIIDTAIQAIFYRPHYEKYRRHSFTERPGFHPPLPIYRCISIHISVWQDGRAVEGVGMSLLACWNCRFESRQRPWCLSLVSVVR